MRRGFTLIELMAAIGLLSLIMVAGSGWVVFIAQSQSSLSQSLDWESSARAVLQLIHDDITTGDWALSDQSRSDSKESRITVQGSRLTLTTRTWGRASEKNEYQFNQMTGELSGGSNEKNNREPPLLTRVQSFDCELLQEGKMLIVSLTSQDGDVATRRYRLP